MKKIINLIVKSENVGLRTDVFINKKESLLSRTRIKNLILKKKLKFNNQIIINPSKKVITTKIGPILFNFKKVTIQKHVASSWNKC